MPLFRIIRILLLGIVVLNAIPAHSSEKILKTYLPGDFGAIGNTYSGDAHPNGMIYFANSDGLLEFDGCHWRNIGPQGFGKVISVFVSSDGLIYLGGNDHIAYLRVDNNFEYEYFPLYKDLDTAIKFQEVWQILENQGNIYFQSYEQLLKWDGKEAQLISFPDAYIFEETGKLFASNFDGKFVEIINGELHYSKNELPIKDDGVFSVESLDENRLLLFTSENGIFEYNIEKRVVLPWINEASSFLKNADIYHSLPLKKGKYIVSTGIKGIVSLDTNGNILSQLNPTLGIENGGWREMFKDNYGDIWLCSDYGLIKIENAVRPTGLYPTARIRRIISDGKEYKIQGIKKVSFSERPEHINIRFSSPGIEASHLQFSYFLEGRDKEWSSWDSVPFANIDDLSGGEYTFYIKSRTNEGLVSEPDQLFLSMPLLWYLNPWMYAAILVSLTSSIFLFMRFRSISMRKKSEELEREVLERTNRIEEQKIELQTINERLREKNLELDNFVYRSSHDLTAPLKSIRGLIELSRLEKDSKKYLHLMEESLLRLENFIETVTAYSSNNKQEVIVETLNFGEEVRGVFQDLKFIKGAQRIEAKFDFEEGLNIKTDKRKLNIILNNLISNAVKYQNFKQEHPFIMVKANRENGSLKFSVIDNGQGIASDHLDKIFEMFFRASENSEGSGLGLYIVKEAVDKLHGEIRARSVVGEGTRFELEFPQD